MPRRTRDSTNSFDEPLMAGPIDPSLDGSGLWQATQWAIKTALPLLQSGLCSVSSDCFEHVLRATAQHNKRNKSFRRVIVAVYSLVASRRMIHSIMEKFYRRQHLCPIVEERMFLEPYAQDSAFSYAFRRRCGGRVGAGFAFVLLGGR